MEPKKEKREFWAPAFPTLLEIAQEVVKGKEKYLLKFDKQDEWLFNKEYGEIGAKIVIPDISVGEETRKTIKELSEKLPHLNDVLFFKKGLEALDEAAIKMSLDPIKYDKEIVRISLVYDKENKIVPSVDIANSIWGFHGGGMALDYEDFADPARFRENWRMYGLIVYVDTTKKIGREFLNKMKAYPELSDRMIELKSGVYVYPACENDKELIKEDTENRHKIKEIPPLEVVVNEIVEKFSLSCPFSKYMKLFPKHEKQIVKFLEGEHTNKEFYKFLKKLPEAKKIISKYDEGAVQGFRDFVVDFRKRIENEKQLDKMAKTP